jgi:hypothetical protein
MAGLATAQLLLSFCPACSVLLSLALTVIFRPISKVSILQATCHKSKASALFFPIGMVCTRAQLASRNRDRSSAPIDRGTNCIVHRTISSLTIGRKPTSGHQAAQKHTSEDSSPPNATCPIRRSEAFNPKQTRSSLRRFPSEATASIF